MMKLIRIFPISVILAGVVPMIGCGHKADVTGQLQNAESELAKSEPAPAAPAVAQNAPAPQSNQATAAADTAVVAVPSQQMKQAMVAYKAGNLEDAVTRLQKLRATPTMNPQQRIALN